MYMRYSQIQLAPSKEMLIQYYTGPVYIEIDNVTMGGFFYVPAPSPSTAVAPIPAPALQ